MWRYQRIPPSSVPSIVRARTVDKGAPRHIGGVPSDTRNSGCPHLVHTASALVNAEVTGNFDSPPGDVDSTAFSSCFTFRSLARFGRHRGEGGGRHVRSAHQ